MQFRRSQLAIAALIALAALVGVQATHAVPKRAAGGSIVFGAEQEPPCLNGFTSGCNNTWTSWAPGIALAQPYIVYPDFSIRPYMATARVVSRKPFTLLVRLNKRARWSDGTQVTADDLIFTWRTIVNPKWDIASRSGWDSIARGVKVNAKTVRFVYKTPYAPWKVQLGSIAVLPKHALEGEDFNSVWNNNYNNKQGAEMASGPFKIASYVKGQSLTMVRNPYFFGHKPSVDRITFRFITVTDSEVQAIRGGEVDAIYPQPQLQLAGLRQVSGLRVQTNAGAQVEHIDMNVGAGNSNPLLAKRWFRQAIAYSIDRGAMVKQLFRSLNAQLRPLQNLLYTNQQKGKYVPHFARYSRNVKRVTSLFRSHGCTKGNDGIWSCGGTRASVRLATTTGNKLRELAEEILQAQAKSAGIEFRPDNQPSKLFFPRIADKKYDLALFAWVGTGDPAGWVDIYGCADPKTADNPTGAGGSNWKSYCVPPVTNLLRASDRELNPARRITDVDRADQLLARDAVSIPLYQKPTYFVFKTKMRGLRDNPTLQGPTWNTERWVTG